MYKQSLVHPKHPSPRISSRLAAAVYNQAGDEYVNYADGNPERLFCFDGPHAYADRQLWSVIEKKLGALRAAGVSSITVLDAGCGPGTWLRRVVTHAHRLGFSKISARGFDVAVAQVQAARRLARDLAGVPGVCLTFEVADLLDRLSEPDASVDITLCLYSVLSHLPVLDLPKVVSEFARVTRGYFIATVRSIGSAPTAFVDSIEEAKHFKLDHRLDRCELEFRNGCHIAVNFHLFAAHELKDLFQPLFGIEGLRGLDIFHTRFIPDRRWNPASVLLDERLMLELTQLEETYAADPQFMDRATHLLLVGCHQPRSSGELLTGSTSPSRQFVRSDTVGPASSGFERPRLVIAAGLRSRLG
jgi:SAM-dependent methyltransferase